jgi:hypothetical protein
VPPGQNAMPKTKASPCNSQQRGAQRGRGGGGQARGPLLPASHLLHALWRGFAGVVGALCPGIFYHHLRLGPPGAAAAEQQQKRGQAAPRSIHGRRCC